MVERGFYNESKDVESFDSILARNKFPVNTDFTKNTLIFQDKHYIIESEYLYL